MPPDTDLLDVALLAQQSLITRDALDAAAHRAAWGIASIAFPRLACGLGGLDWDAVEPVMRRNLEPLPINVAI